MWFKKKNLESVINETKKVKVKGFTFIIKKINVLDHLKGSSSLVQIYETFKISPQNADELSINKIKKHYADVICDGVVEPLISRKEDGPGVYINKLFCNWQLCEQLYKEIMFYTHGKKKVR